jgi:hypothetical protein
VNLELSNTLDEASNLTGLETHWIRFADRERRGKGREQHRYGTQQHVLGNRVEETIKGIIESFQDQIPSDTHLILTAICSRFRITGAINPLPKLIKLFHILG